MNKLDIQHKHIMRLIDRDKGENGWTSVSAALYPHLVKNMPSLLVEFSGSSGCYSARLTEKGRNILEAMEWL